MKDLLETLELQQESLIKRGELMLALPRATLITSGELMAALPKASEDSRYGKVKRLLASGKLVQLRKGLYYSANNPSAPKPHPFALAPFIYGLSYISLESALSYHQLIPESVYTTTSVTAKRSTEFNTPLGVFSYTKVPLENLYLGVELIKENNHQFLLAKPWKAICDYIYCYKKNWRSLTPLTKDLRINLDDLAPLSLTEIEQYKEYYHHSRMTNFLKGIQKTL